LMHASVILYAIAVLLERNSSMAPLNSWGGFYGSISIVTNHLHVWRL
jgi:hypothetical protein